MLELTVAPGLAPPFWLEEALAAEAAWDEAGARHDPPLRGRSASGAVGARLTSPASPDEIRPLRGNSASPAAVGAGHDPPGDLEVDVAIVGAGYTGLWTALALHERDPSLRVALLEKEIVGWGPSGRNGGFLHGYWSHASRLLAGLGRDRTLELCRLAERIVPAVRAFCESRAEDVWLREGGYLKVSAAPAQDAGVERAIAAARVLGAAEECVPLTAAEVARRVSSPRFRRGAFFRDGATVQPARLARALRRAVLAVGAALYERTPLQRLVAGSPSLLETPRGRLRAREVVLATNAWAAGFGPVSRRLTNFGSYVVLTEPVPALLEEIGWTGGEAISDARMFLHYFRTTPDGRVLMGSGSGPVGRGGRVDARFTNDHATAARAELGLRKLLPGLAEARVTHAWGGPIDVSSDHLPFFGTAPETRVHYGLGYSGSGVGASWLGGQILASLVTGADDEYARLPLVARRVPALPPEPLRFVGGSVVRGAILACEELEEDGLPAPPYARAAAALPRLAGLRIGTR